MAMPLLTITLDGDITINNYSKEPPVNSSTCLVSDGTLENATFCHPSKLYRVSGENSLLVLDSSSNHTCIRYIDLDVGVVLTTFVSDVSQYGYGLDITYTSDANKFDVIMVTDESNLVSFSGNLKDNSETALDISCFLGNTDSCAIRLPSVKDTFTSLSVDGNLLAAVNEDDYGYSSIYLIDMVNNRVTTLCGHVENYWDYESGNSCPNRASAVAFIGGYLYIGESSYYATGDFSVRRIKYKITG